MDVEIVACIVVDMPPQDQWTTDDWEVYAATRALAKAGWIIDSQAEPIEMPSVGPFRQCTPGRVQLMLRKWGPVKPTAPPDPGAALPRENRTTPLANVSIVCPGCGLEFVEGEDLRYHAAEGCQPSTSKPAPATEAEANTLRARVRVLEGALRELFALAKHHGILTYSHEHRIDAALAGEPMPQRQELALERAIKVATVYHRGQVDKAGQPYILHPLSVMLRVRAVGESETAQIAAVLHDVVEDTPYTLAHVEQEFGAEVARIVDCLTRRQGETYQGYIERVKENPIAAVVKVADLRDNLDPARHAWAVDYPDKFTSLKRRYETALETLAGEPAAPEETVDYHRGASARVRKQDLQFAEQPPAPLPKCVRCGAPYLPTGQCSRHAEGCQGGRGEGRTGVSKPIDAESLSGITFYDSASNCTMRYIYPDVEHWSAGWIVVKNPSGEWMTLREATDGDIQAINAAVVSAHHSVAIWPDAGGPHA